MPSVGVTRACKSFVNASIAMSYPRPTEVLQQVEKLEQFINDWRMIPTTGARRNQVPLAILAKALTVDRAACVPVEKGFPAEEFGLSHTLVDQVRLRDSSAVEALRASRAGTGQSSTLGKARNRTPGRRNPLGSHTGA